MKNWGGKRSFLAVAPLREKTIAQCVILNLKFREISLFIKNGFSKFDKPYNYYLII